LRWRRVVPAGLGSEATGDRRSSRRYASPPRNRGGTNDRDTNDCDTDDTDDTSK
jgi:hypothetical protein